MLECCYYYYLDEFLAPALVLLILELVGTDLRPVVVLLTDDVHALSGTVDHFVPLELPHGPRIARKQMSLQDFAARRVRED